MKKIWLLFLVISLVLPLHGMQLQLQGAEAVVEKAVQGIPTLKNLCLKTVAEKTVTLAFEQELEETGYDYDESKRWVDDIIFLKTRSVPFCVFYLLVSKGRSSKT